jgi:hypothetical protein
LVFILFIEVTIRSGIMDNSDPTPTMQEILAEMAVMRAELNELKQRANSVRLAPGAVEQLSKPVVSTTRRSTLKRLGLALLGGVTTATAINAGPVTQAKIIANPNTNGMTNRVGMLVVPPGAVPPTGSSIPFTNTYGLVASADKSNPLIVSNLSTGADTGLVGFGSGDGQNGYGVQGLGYTGVYGLGSFIGAETVGAYYGVVATASNDITGVGVKATGSKYAVWGMNNTGGGLTAGIVGEGTNIGVWGKGTNSGAGIYGESTSGFAGQFVNKVSISAPGSISSPALRVDATSTTAGIGAIIANNSADTPLLLSNAGSGPLFKAWGAGGIPKVEITNGGLIKANGGYQTGGADLAEVIPITSSLESGDVVEIDPVNSGFFRRCATAGSLAVAGVISTRPGVILGVPNSADANNTNSRPQLALAGRIPVKVTDEGGSIQPGDLLIASATPGYAKRASKRPRTGSVVGKALGRLESGTGLVEMLIMLR